VFIGDINKTCQGINVLANWKMDVLPVHAPGFGADRTSESLAERGVSFTRGVFWAVLRGPSLHLLEGKGGRACWREASSQAPLEPC